MKRRLVKLAIFPLLAISPLLATARSTKASPVDPLIRSQLGAVRVTAFDVT